MHTCSQTAHMAQLSITIHGDTLYHCYKASNMQPLTFKKQAIQNGAHKVHFSVEITAYGWDLKMTAQLITENILSMLYDVAQKLTNVQGWPSNKSDVDYIYYKLARLEHILSLSVQVVNINDWVYLNIWAAKCLIGNVLQDEESVITFNMQTTLTGDWGRPKYIISKNRCSISWNTGLKDMK